MRRLEVDGVVVGNPVGVAEGTWTGWAEVRGPYGRREQFLAGRRAAGAALSAAGSADRTVPRGTDGRPCFPRGYAGSIAHTDRLAVAVVAPGAVGVGVDVEDADISARVARFVLRGRERRVLLAPGGRYCARDLFAAKEAAFKALSDPRRTEELLFWRIALEDGDDGLVAAHRGTTVPVQVRSADGLSIAVALRW